jgi:chromosome partitioning protein
MRVVAVVCQKGGSGKTTAATELAVLSVQRGYATVVFDVDPQASAAMWSDDRGGEPPQVVPAQAPRLPVMLAAAEKQGAELVFVDTGPSADSAALAAAKAADIILVPAKTTVRDLKALGPTLKTIADVVPNKRLVVILSMVPVRGAVTAEAVRYLFEADIEVCPVRLHQRADFYNGLGAGKASVEWEPGGKAAAEATALWEWLCTQLGIPGRACAPKRASANARIDAGANARIEA